MTTPPPGSSDYISIHITLIHHIIAWNHKVCKRFEISKKNSVAGTIPQTLAEFCNGTSLHHCTAQEMFATTLGNHIQVMNISYQFGFTQPTSLGLCLHFLCVCVCHTPHTHTHIHTAICHTETNSQVSQ